MKKIARLFSKKLRFTYAIVALGLVVPTIVFAANTKLINGVAEFFFRFFLFPVIGLLRLELWILPMIASYNNFTREQGVIDGWVAVRDLTNTFFILVLLIIAFATILRISSYGYKQLLSRLLIVAILVNFSMTIVGLAIDLSQIVMMTFLNVIKDITAGNIMVGLGLQNAFGISENFIEAGGSVDIGDYVASLVIAGIMLLITAVIMGAFVAMLAMRVVTLWISLVLSPAAFVAFVFPSAKKYYQQWSLDLGKNLVTGPALMFFLWLTFTIITKSPNIGESMGASPGDQLGSVSALTESANVIKYIIGTALLLGGLQFAAKSGAAGAGAMAWGSNKINSAASHVGKRYIGGTLSRAGYMTSRAIVNKDGSMKGVAKVAGVVPFWGGRLQRSAIKMQGYEAQRIAKIKSEDEKYVKDTQKVNFEGSQSTMGRTVFAKNENDSKLKSAGKTAGRILGTGYSAVTSLGGNYERSIMEDLAKIERGDINIGNAEQLTNSARTMGKEELMQRVQSQYMTYQDEGEVNRLLEKGLGAVMSNIKGDAMLDKNGKATEGAMHWASALGKHYNTDANAMFKLGMQNDKADRWAMNTVIKEHLLQKDGGSSKNPFSVDEDGYVKTDKKKMVNLNLDELKEFLGLMKIYPQQAADEHDENTGAIDRVGIFARQVAAVDPEKLKFEPGTVAGGLSQASYETDEEFKNRHSEAVALDRINPEDESTLPTYLQGKSPEEIEEYRQKKYREVHLLTRRTDEMGNTEDENGNSIDKYWQEDTGTPEGDRAMLKRFNRRKIARYDTKFQDDGFAKETREQYEERKKEAQREESEEEYEARIDAMMPKMAAVTNVSEEATKGMTDEEVSRYQLRKKRIIAGDRRADSDLITRSLWTEIWDGGDGDRFNELSQNKQGERELAHSAVPFMDKHNINQAWPGGVANQSEALAMGVNKSGHAPTKPQIENLAKGPAAKAMQAGADVTNFRNGHAVDDPNIVGPVHYQERPIVPIVGKTISSLTKGDTLEDRNGTKSKITSYDERSGRISMVKDAETVHASMDELSDLIGREISVAREGDVFEGSGGMTVTVRGLDRSGGLVLDKSSQKIETNMRSLTDNMDQYVSADREGGYADLPSRRTSSPDRGPDRGGSGPISSDGSAGPIEVVVTNLPDGGGPATVAGGNSSPESTSRSGGSDSSSGSGSSSRSNNDTRSSEPTSSARSDQGPLIGRLNKMDRRLGDSSSATARAAREARDEASGASDKIDKLKNDKPEDKRPK